MGVRQSTNHVLMVAPTAFGFNDQAAQDNHFMHASTGSSEADSGAHTRTVLREFAGLHHQLTEVGTDLLCCAAHSVCRLLPPKASSSLYVLFVSRACHVSDRELACFVAQRFLQSVCLLCS